MSTITSGSLNLKIFHNHQLVDRKTLSGGVIKIGRLESSHLRLDDASIARMHAVIEMSGSDVRVVDLGSSTGTLLNGRRIEKHAVLGNGDELQVGPYRVQAELVSAPAAATSAPSPGAGMGTRAATALAAPTRPIAERPAMQVDASTVEITDGRRVAEVTTVYGNTILDVQHVGQVRSRRQAAPAILALGGLMLLGGGAFFAADVAQDWDAHHARVEAAHEAGRPMPQAPGTGLGSLGIAIAFLGLVPLGIGAVRMRDVGLSDYTIGEGHAATFSVSPQGLPDADAFALVRDGEDGPVVNFVPGMKGSVTAGGRTLTLAELAQSGHAAATGSSHAFALPADAACTIEHAGLTFHVKSVAPGRVIAGKTEADKPFWLYNAASFAMMGSLLVLTHLVPDDALAMGLDDQVADNRFVGYMNRPDAPPEEETLVEHADSTEDAGGQGQRHHGAEGQAGKPTSKQAARLYAMKGPKDAVPQLARTFDPAVAASRAGILGMMQQESGHFLASPYGGAFAVGNDDEDAWGGFIGTEIGESFGVGGLGVIGTGRGGGGTGEGTLGYGKVGLIGKGGGGGEASGYGRGKGIGHGTRGKKVPVVRQATTIVRGELDKDIIRRIVRNHINEVRYCYNQALARDPNAAGRVAVQFTIGPTGKVAGAVVQESSLPDRGSANCIATAVKRWSFPKPRNGGNVMVTYPFVLAPG
jgi:TonB family protein